MTSRLGVYWSVSHRRPQDYEFFKRLNPSVMKVMDGGDVDYAWIKANLPDSLVVARIHSMSEEHGDMLKDPEGTGKRHAREWDTHQRRLGFDRARTLILGINEPRIWEAGVPEALRVYTIALCDEATKLGLRVGAMQLSVGWPNNDGPDTLPNWSAWHGVDNAIRRNNGALVGHEYFADNGPGENWGWWCGRILKCPWQVPVVIGECGIDLYVKNSSVGQQARGWRGHKEPEQYARELADYVARMSVDSRFVGCAVFASDFAHNEWASFDIEPAYKAILATPIPVAPSTTPQTTHIPSIGTGPQPVQPATLFVIVPAGAKLRTAPDLETGDVVDIVPFGASVTVHGYDKGSDGKQWARAWYEDAGKTWGGWIRGDLLGLQKPEPTPTTPEPQPMGDNWSRCIAFVRRWEGGWADDLNDPGGATNKGITIGTYKRWREVQGQPEPTKDDLRALSDAEANRIYYEFYWLVSGSDQLDWPLCLAHFDTAVNAGPGRAAEMLERSNGVFLAYMGHLIDWYARIDGFEHFGRAWMRRRADLLLEASK